MIFSGPGTLLNDDVAEHVDLAREGVALGKAMLKIDRRKWPTPRTNLGMRRHGYAD